MGEYKGEDPGWGRRLLPHIINDIAKTQPDRTFIKMPSGNVASEAHAYRTVTYAQFAAAIDKTAWWLRETLGEPTGFPTVAYFGPQDLIYPLLTLAGSKVGWKIFFPSPRNDLKAHLSLLEAYRCDTLMLPSGPAFRGMFSKVIQESKIRCLDVPAIDHFLDVTSVTPYPWSKSFEEGRLDPLLTIQTSGSTGLPKPVVMPQGSVSSTDAYHRLPGLGLRPMVAASWEGHTALSLFPFFHAAGMGIFFNSIIYGYILVVPPSGPPHAQMVADLVKQHDITVGMLAPSIIVDLAKDHELVNTVKRLEYIFYGGGPLPTDIGNEVSKMTHLITAFGGTEFGFMPMAVNDDEEDWIYMDFPKQSGVVMRPYTDNLYELVFVRDPTLEDYQTIFMTFPDMQEYASKDLFTPHPTKSELWRFSGRSDDIIVYSTGNKFNPSRMEDTLNGHSKVKSALMFGTARFQSALLIEPEQHPVDEQANEALIDSIWPTVHRINNDSPGCARVMKHMILITTGDKPFPRAGKGTVQRKLAIDLYSTELDELYSAYGMEKSQDHDSQDLATAILDAIHRIAGLEHIKATDRLFDSGMDSLGAVTLARAIRMVAPEKAVAAADVYRCGSVDGLAAFMRDSDKRSVPSTDRMQALYKEYTTDLPITARSPIERPEKRVVLLTGSTGSLGCYLLHALLQDHTISEIVCLNRRADAEDRQAASMQDKGLSRDFGSVTFLQADMSREYLGVGIKPYQQLLHKVTHILHNAWLVNFNTSLEDFSTHVKGVRQLVDFSARSRYGASIIFLSSIGAVQKWKGGATVPATIVEDWKAAGEVGYSQSKLVSERILAKAATDAGVPCAICRLGQIAGPVSMRQGVWPKQEWLPSLLYSAKHLGCLPDSIGSLDMVDWVPVEMMADIVLEYMTSFNGFTNPTVYHAVNPAKTSWTKLAPFISKRLGVTMVSLAEWVEKLSKSDPDAVDANPALKLIDFFRNITVHASGQVQLGTENSCVASMTLKSVDAVNEECLDIWLEQWGLSR